MTRPLVFIDTETDSLGPGRRIWEIGMVRRDPRGIETKTRMFLPIDLARSDVESLRIGGFFDRHPSGRKIAGRSHWGKVLPIDSTVPTTLHEVAKVVMRWTADATIVGACPWFDTETVGNLLRREGYIPTWHHRLVCVESMHAGYLGLDEPLGLAAVAKDLGVKAGHEHTALGDALTAMRVYDELRRLAAYDLDDDDDAADDEVDAEVIIEADA